MSAAERAQAPLQPRRRRERVLPEAATEPVPPPRQVQAGAHHGHAGAPPLEARRGPDGHRAQVARPRPAPARPAGRAQEGRAQEDERRPQRAPLPGAPREAEARSVPGATEHESASKATGSVAHECADDGIVGTPG